MPASAARAVALAGLLLALPDALAAEPAGEPAPAELVQRVLDTNTGWASPPLVELSYTFTMQQLQGEAAWSATVKLTPAEPEDGQPCAVATIRPNNEAAQERQVTSEYDPQNSAYPPLLCTLQQGMTFFGPMHDWCQKPERYEVRLLGEGQLAGADVWKLALVPVQPPAKLEAAGNQAEPGGEPIIEERIGLRVVERQAEEPQAFAPMRVGCGIYGSWFGYTGSGATEDILTVDKATGSVLREEGLYEDQPRFTVDYSEFEALPEGGRAPLHVVLTLSPGTADEWSFDMRFTTVGGLAYLMESVTETQAGRGAVVFAETADATAEPALEPAE